MKREHRITEVWVHEIKKSLISRLNNSKMVNISDSQKIPLPISIFRNKKINMTFFSVQLVMVQKENHYQYLF